MLKRVAAYIRKYNMLETGSRVVIGLSGGPDSVCLFHVLSQLRAEFELDILAVHVHHGLRGDEADRDAEFVKRFSAEYEAPSVIVYVNVPAYAAEHGVSEEEAGRILRYQALRRQASKWGGGNVRVAVGHQMEDQAETILHNLFRGSSLKGLAGMSPVSGDIIRPLLCVSRQEIRDYLKRNGLSFCVDSTNETSAYTRNRIRRMLSQVCGEVNAGAVKHILAAGEKIALADEYFGNMADALWEEQGTEDKGRRCGMKVSVLRDQPDIVAGYLVMKMLRVMTGSAKDITSAHVEQICMLADGRTGRTVSLPYGLRALREYDMLWLERDREAANNDFAEENFSFSHFPYKKNQEIPQKKYTKWFDYDKIKSALSVRTRQAGDYITLKDGGHKTVKSFMIDEKIPRQQRDKILLLTEGNHVLWIVGYRISEYYKITDETKEILQVQTGGEEHGREDSGVVI